MHRLLIGLGGNIGDEPARASVLRMAWQDVVRGLGLRGGRLSSIHVSRPAEGVGGGQFANAVGVGWARLPASDALERLQAIERAWGRRPRRSAEPEPRLLDLDLLDVGGVVLTTRGLTLPHPRLLRRDFVLAPLCELAPGYIEPRHGRSALRSLRALAAHERTLEIGR